MALKNTPSAKTLMNPTQDNHENFMILLSHLWWSWFPPMMIVSFFLCISWLQTKAMSLQPWHSWIIVTIRVRVKTSL